MTDGVFTQKLHLTTADADLFQRLRMSALFRMLQEISIAHTERLGAGRGKTLDCGALWVMSRMRVEILRMPRYDEDVTLLSWPGETMHVIFPRYYQMLGNGGEKLLQASGMWLLMDRTTRKMSFPGAFGVHVPGVSTGEETPLPESIPLPGLPSACERAVRYSELDLNGHVNNTRYLDWLDDLFDISHHRAHAWHEVQINYVSEIPPEASVRLSYRMEDGCCWLSGAVGDRTAFQIAARYA